MGWGCPSQSPSLITRDQGWLYVQDQGCGLLGCWPQAGCRWALSPIIRIPSHPWRGFFPSQPLASPFMDNTQQGVCANAHGRSALSPPCHDGHSERPTACDGVVPSSWAILGQSGQLLSPSLLCSLPISLPFVPEMEIAALI